ncbi:MAG: toxin [Bacteroidota bacterium]
MEVTQIEAFLKDFKEKLGFWGIMIRSDREKNKATMLALEIYMPQIKQVLQQLTVQDYSEGPLTETLYKGADMWVFGKLIKSQEVYIKISLGVANQALCISFHFSDYPMSYPFKNTAL